MGSKSPTPQFRRRLVLMLTGLLLVVGAVSGFNFAFNPLAVWRHRLISDLFYRIDLNRVMTPGLLRTANAGTVLLGNSRVHFGIPIEQGFRAGVQNAAMPGASLAESLKEIDVALAANPHLRRVVWGIDFSIFDSALLDHADPQTMARLNGDLEPLLLETLLSGETLKLSGALIGRRLRGAAALPPTWRAPVPWPASLICQALADPARYRTFASNTSILAQMVHAAPDYRHFHYSPVAMARTLAAAARLRQAGVELILFIPPLSRYELELIRQSGAWPAFQDWKRRLATALPVWDFSGYNALADQDQLFMDLMHMNPGVGQLILRRLLGQSQPACPRAALVWQAGLRIDAANVATMLALQERRQERASAQPSPYSRLAAQGLAQRYGAQSMPGPNHPR